MKTKTKRLLPPVEVPLKYNGATKADYVAKFTHLTCETWGERIAVESTERKASFGLTFEAVQALYEYMLECRKDRDKAERETLEQWKKELESQT